SDEQQRVSVQQVGREGGAQGRESREQGKDGYQRELKPRADGSAPARDCWRRSTSAHTANVRNRYDLTVPSGERAQERSLATGLRYSQLCCNRTAGGGAGQGEGEEPEGEPRAGLPTAGSRESAAAVGAGAAPRAGQAARPRRARPGRRRTGGSGTVEHVGPEGHQPVGGGVAQVVEPEQ